MGNRCCNCETLIPPASEGYKHFINHEMFSGETIWCERCNKIYPGPSYKKRRYITLTRIKLIAKIKLQRGCEWESGCEYTEGKKIFALMLDLDHIEPSQKTAEISFMAGKLTYTWEDILNEIEKCRVICKMHHAIVPSSTKRLTKTEKAALLPVGGQLISA
jgi:hypothetical protein